MTNFINRAKSTGMMTVLFMMVSLIMGMSACQKDSAASFTAAFSYTMTDEHHVHLVNTSTGEYYSLIWDFGNGQADTTTRKTQDYTIYYPKAGEYTITLTLQNYTGEKTSSSQKVVVNTNDFSISFTADIDAENPNYVNLVNTSQGNFDSFRWTYLGQDVENEPQVQAYFPYKGIYEITLTLFAEGEEYKETKTVTIAQDDSGVIPNLVWSDEFEYTGLPVSSNWNMETGGDGWGNNELQYYTGRAENASVADGILTITALKEDYGGRAYTSARITTQNKFDIQYGKIEARMKLPYGQGLWPAFWMLGADIGSVGWPACGEIDIMEMVGGSTGGDKTVYSTLHWDDNGHASYGESYTLPSGTFSDDFHTFSVIWNAQEIIGYVDDIEYFVINITPQQLSEFHHNFFIILNVAVGGAWPGSPDDTTVFPQTMEVDYVRVYSLSK